MNEAALQIEIDKCVYLASMASDWTAIDTKLDRLRIITVKLKGVPDAAVDPRYAKDLQALQAEIKSYLVNDEPLRQFNAQTIEEKLFEHVSGHSTMRYLRQSLAAILAVAILLPVGTILLPLQLDQQLRIVIAMTTFLALLYVGAAWLMLSALKWFKSELRRAYLWICAGMTLVGVSQLQGPVILAANLNESVWVAAGGNTFPFVVASIFLYIGVRKTARLVGVTSHFMSTTALTLTAVLSSVVAVLLPHADVKTPELYFDCSIVLFVNIVVLNVFFVALMRSVSRKVTAQYAKSMKWLYAVFVISTVCNIGIVMLMYFNLIEQFVGVITLPFIVSAFCALKAGYEFNKIIR